jgi:hypothetical protein
MSGYFRVVVSILLAFSAIACGRRATEVDCQTIVDAVVDAELRAMNITDAATLQKKRDELRPAFKDDLKTCVGRRITDGMMSCVKAAQTSQAIHDCIR